MVLEKQIQIVKMVALGDTTNEIAVKLGVRPKTAQKYMEIIKAAHEARNAPNLVFIFTKRGLIS